MTLSRRDRRIGIYTYANTGREGVIVDTWTLAGTYWGRVDDYRGSSRMVAGAPEIAVDSVIQLSDEHYVAPNSIAVDGTLLLDASH
jgi:head-tail adaptor